MSDLLPNDTTGPPLPPGASFAAVAMHSIFGKMPYPWQQTVLDKLTKMLANNCCAPLLLVRPTGGGKSAVRDTFAVLLAGVTLTITPLLSLGADQAKKVLLNASVEFGSVTAFHHDEMKDPATMQMDLVEKLLSLPSDTTKTVLLFMSPQALQNNTCWQVLVKKLLISCLLRFVALNEIHLFVHFGMTFRLEFAALKELLFQYLLGDSIPGKTCIPILLITATCSKNILNYLQLLSGLTIESTFNCLWPEPCVMEHRHVYSREVLGPCFLRH